MSNKSPFLRHSFHYQFCKYSTKFLSVLFFPFSVLTPFGGFIMANLFAYRATSPCDMKSAEQPVGELNEYWLEQSISSCKVVIVCWGGNGSHLNRHIEVNELLKKHANNTPILCFGKTKAGQPKHPLYLASNTELINYFN